MNDISGNNQAGFTLIETLIAVAIAGVAFAVLLPVFAEMVGRADRAAERQMSALIAESKLAEFGESIPLIVGETSGRVGERYRWQSKVTYQPQFLKSLKYKVGIYRIQLSVIPDGVSEADVVTLETLRIGKNFVND